MNSVKVIFCLGVLLAQVGGGLHAETLINYSFDGVSFPDALIVQDTSGNQYDLHFCRPVGLSEKSAKDEVSAFDDRDDRSADVTLEASTPIWGIVQGSIPSIKTFTLEGWVKPVNFQEGSEIWVLRDAVGAARVVLGYDRTGTVNATVVDANSYGQELVGAAIAINEWSHLALTFDGELFSLYVNGEQVCSTAGGEAFEFQSPLIGIFGGDKSFFGFCDAFRISDIALNSEELGWNEVER